MSRTLQYKGSAPALQDVLGGHADYVFDPGIAMSHIRERRFADAATEAVAMGGTEFRKLLDDERKLLENLIKTRNITAD